MSARLRDLEEALGAGVVPEPERWAALGALPEPWGSLSRQSVEELRRQGGAVLPTLRRLRHLSEHHAADLADARARSAQALAQAGVSLALIPGFSGLLRWLLPGVDGARGSWWEVTGFAFALAAVGALWMVRLAEDARWGGAPRHRRHWILASACAGERFLALLRSGVPGDLAWVQAGAFLVREAPELADAWGASVWKMEGTAEDAGDFRSAGVVPILRAGEAIRRAVQLTLLEGRPCLDRVETTLQALRQELKTQVDRELLLIGTRILKPLFLCVAPAVLGLLGFGLWLSWTEAGAGAGF